MDVAPLEDVAGQYREALLAVWRRLAGEGRECSGAVYKDGSYSFCRCDAASAKVDGGSAFIWHSHPGGALALSQEDWLCFFCSEAAVTALFTRRGILVLRKKARHALLREKLLECAGEFRGYPSVVFCKMASCVGAFFGADLEAVPAGKWPEFFGVDHFVLRPPRR